MIIATAPKNCVSNSARTSVVTFLNGRAVAVTGVVDQDVDAAELLLCLLDGVGNLRGLCDVERKCEDSVRVVNREVRDPPDIPGGDDRVVTSRDHRLRQGAPESGGASSDQPGGHVNVFFC